MYNVALSAFGNFPVVPHFGLLWIDDETLLSAPMSFAVIGEWGNKLEEQIPLSEPHALPCKLSAVWISIIEEKFYFFECNLDQNKIGKIFDILKKIDNSEISFVLGLGPYGFCSLWVLNDKKSMIVESGIGDEIEIEMEEFLPARPDLSISDFCKLMINQTHPCILLMSTNEFAKRFKSINKEYLYKFFLSFGQYRNNEWEQNPEKYKNISSENLWIKRTDGTYDKTNDGSLFAYHSAGKPYKLALEWSAGKMSYSAYFWFEEEALTEIFERFYGAHPETKADFIIRIDAENRKYELALYRQGLKEPVVIPEEAYQMIVFKNKFEDYRSANYNQPRGAWIW